MSEHGPEGQGMPAPPEPEIRPPQEDALPAPTPDQQNGRRTEAEREPLREMITPVVSRIALGGAALNPEHPIDTLQAAESLRQKDHNDINYTGINTLTENSREKHWEGVSKEDANTRWKAGFETWLQNNAQDENSEMYKAVKALGIDVKKDSDLSNQIDTFRKTYFKKGKSDVAEFVKDLTLDCKDKDEALKRIQEAKPLFRLFGKEEDFAVETLVGEYAKTHAVLSEKNPDKRKEINRDLLRQSSEPVKAETEEQTSLLHAGMKRLAEIETRTQEQEEQEAKQKALETLITGKKGEAEEREALDTLRARKDYINRLILEDKEVPQELTLTQDEQAKLDKGLWKPAEGKDEATQLQAFESTLRQLAKDSDVQNLSDETIKAWITHEQAHFRRAGHYGLNPNFSIQLEKVAGEKIHVRVYTHYNNPPEEGTKEKTADEIKIDIFSAPGIGKDATDLAGMSHHDLIALGMHENGTDTPPVEDARSFIYTDDESKQQTISTYITAQMPEYKDDEAMAKRQLCYKIAQYNKTAPESLTALSQLG